ncbi:hypothetical protein BMETH_439_3 [methanotrophic bacterial endosymbiont of Bathymodiolus sp.]|nr:hypothetical protein BMETH_439_3 [methanotrophic bacterial endosymbiont of Bathymodiolus sp.]
MNPVHKNRVLRVQTMHAFKKVITSNTMLKKAIKPSLFL